MSFIISFEGIDGSGKSTLAYWLNEWLNEHGIKSKYISSVGFEPIGSLTEHLMNDPLTYDPYAYALLSQANSILLFKTIIKSGISKEEIFILDRYFYSTIAYSMALGLSKNWLLALTSVLQPADLIIFCQVKTSIALSRKKILNIIEIGADIHRDSYQSFMEYQEKVLYEYTNLFKDYKNVLIINNNGNIELAKNEIKQSVNEWLKRRAL